MKKILLISYFFPPIQSAESTMTYNLMKYLSFLGWEIIVLSAKKSKEEKIDFSTSLSIPKNIHVYRTFSIENMIFKIFSHFKILPDNKIGWIHFATKRGEKLLKNGDISAIISRSTPITSHLVGLKLSSLTDLPWIACFSDPWTQNPYFFYPNEIIKKFNKNLEKKVMLKADKIVVTTKQMNRLISKEYNTGDKVVTIPNSYDPSEFLYSLPNLCKKSNKKEKKFVISHIGNFYGNRSPEPFLKALKGLDKDVREGIKVRFIGSIGKFKYLISKYKLDDIIEVVDTIPRKNVFIELFNSDILLMIDAPSTKESMFLPSKLLEYINTKKPILAITPEGASSSLINSTKTGIIVSPENIDEIKNAIKYYYDLYHRSELKIEPDWSEIEKYSAKNCAKKLDQILKKVIRQKKQI